MPKAIYIGLPILVAVLILGWLFIESLKPLPGIETPQEGRDHVPEGSQVTYNFNPPTGGDHYASWITKGFYEEPRHDGNLVHSMEHGYVIFWYDCERKPTGWLIKIAYAHEASDSAQSTGLVSMTEGSEGIIHTKLEDMPKAFSDGSCNSTKDKIKDFLSKDPHKLIAMPRIGMDAPFILTAWGETLKLNSFDEGQIKGFINAYRNNGPERTNEP